MIIPTGRTDNAMGVHLHRAYRTGTTDAAESIARRDVVSISKFSALVEHGRAHAFSLPNTRADRVAEARHMLELGDLPGGRDIASAMVNRAVEGQV